MNNNTVKTITIPSPNTTEWVALLFARFKLSPPRYLEITEFAPAPKPVPNPARAIDKGVIKPTAARAWGPNPDTHAVSIKLFKIKKNTLMQ